MDPISVTSLVVITLTLIINIWQSIKFNHFVSECLCCHIDMDNNIK
jgi:hypothetical protein